MGAESKAGVVMQPSDLLDARNRRSGHEYLGCVWQESAWPISAA